MPQKKTVIPKKIETKKVMPARNISPKPERRLESGNDKVNALCSPRTMSRNTNSNNKVSRLTSPDPRPNKAPKKMNHPAENHIGFNSRYYPVFIFCKKKKKFI